MKLFTESQIARMIGIRDEIEALSSEFRARSEKIPDLESAADKMIDARNAMGQIIRWAESSR